MDDSALNGPATAALTLTPIGVLRTGQRVKFQARHQPDESARGQKAGEVNVLELLTGLGLEQAVADLAGFDRVWLVWWFHRNTTWRPMVLPPRGPQQRRGGVGDALAAPAESAGAHAGAVVGGEGAALVDRAVRPGGRHADL